MQVEAALQRIGIDYHKLMEMLNDHSGISGFVTGSIITGRSTSISDLDIRLVCCPMHQHPDKEYLIVREDLTWAGLSIMKSLSEMPLHLVYWPEDVVEMLIGKISETVLESDSFMPVFSAEQLEFLDELREGIPLFNEEYFHQLRSRIDFDKMYQIRLQELISLFNQMVEETRGMILASDHYSALLRAQNTLNCAVDCYLLSNGKVNTKPKWRVRRLLELHGADHQLVKTYCTFLFEGPPVFTLEHSMDFVKNSLAFANDLLLKTQLNM